MFYSTCTKHGAKLDNEVWDYVYCTEDCQMLDSGIEIVYTCIGASQGKAILIVEYILIYSLKIYLPSHKSVCAISVAMVHFFRVTTKSLFIFIPIIL